jgi:hypothetical protein
MSTTLSKEELDRILTAYNDYNFRTIENVVRAINTQRDKNEIAACHAFSVLRLVFDEDREEPDISVESTLNYLITNGAVFNFSVALRIANAFVDCLQEERRERRRNRVFNNEI